jgi:protein tyrosine phosphatase (PTP) superfamily phosphohydrolase (DUF442 family)
MPVALARIPIPRRFFVVGLALMALPALEVVRVTAGPNFHEITPGRLYRSAQLSASELRTVAHRYGIKSIINLRNSCPAEPWYQDEIAAAQELGIVHHNLNFSASLPPAPQELRKLLELLETTPRPVLLHCRRGADRTGLATSLAWLFDHPDESAATRSLLHLRYGHVPLGKVVVMDRVYGEYWTWLGATPHTRDTLRQWVHDHYRPGRCWAKIEPITLPSEIHTGKPAYAKFRVTNLSHNTWHFHPSSNLGVHLRGFIEPVGAQPPPGADKFDPPRERRLISAGFFHAAVPPGGHLELEVAIPAMPEPGPHTIFVDIFDEEQNCFCHMVGSTPFHTVLETTRGPVAGR